MLPSKEGAGAALASAAPPGGGPLMALELRAPPGAAARPAGAAQLSAASSATNPRILVPAVSPSSSTEPRAAAPAPPLYPRGCLLPAPSGRGARRLRFQSVPGGRGGGGCAGEPPKPPPPRPEGSHIGREGVSQG